MKFRVGLALSCAASLTAFYLGCGEDEVFAPLTRGQGGSAPEPSESTPPIEDAGAGIDAAKRRWVLVTKNDDSKSEMSVVNLDTGAVDGRLQDIGRAGASAIGELTPFFVASDRDVVVQLDENAPWTASGTWNVPATDGGVADAGLALGQPIDVVAVSSSKVYVILGKRNELAVIETNAPDASVGTRTIDLSPYLSPFDSDGAVEAVAGYYVAPRKMLYLLLGSVDQSQKDIAGTGLACTKVKAKVIGIDVTSDAVVSMRDGGTPYVELTGYSQTLRDSLAYDPSADRLLVASRGCNESGLIARRQVEGINLANGEVSSLLMMNDQPIPRALVRIDAFRVAIAFEGATRMWNPSSPLLGDLIGGAPEIFAYDGDEHLVGLRTTTGDAGIVSVEVVRTSLPLSDAGPTSDASDGAVNAPETIVIQPAPFSSLSGTGSRVQFWSR